MADISFLLLIFFLVATTMNVDTGLMRVLPPMPPEDQKVEDQKVKERNLLLVFVSASGNIMAGDENMDIHGIKDKAKDFILNTYDDENLPEKEDQEFELPDGSNCRLRVIPTMTSTSWCRTSLPAPSTKYAMKSQWRSSGPSL